MSWGAFGHDLSEVSTVDGFALPAGASSGSDGVRAVSSIIDLLRPWVNAHAADLAARNLQVCVTEGPREYDKPSVWVDIDGPTRLVQLVVWASGEAVLSVADIVTGELLNEELELTGEFGLRQALGSAVAWAEGGGR
jgi:hypothetical protein